MKRSIKKKQKNRGTKFEVDIVSSTRKTENKKIAIISAIVGVIVIVIALLVFIMVGDSAIRDVGIVAGILIVIFPYTLKQLQHVKKLENIDYNLPLLIQSLVSSVESGSTLIRAFEHAADRKLGLLTPELKNFRANISWGMSLEDAFSNLQRRVQTNLSVRVFTLLHISINMGGDVLESLEVIRKHVTDSKNIEKERKSSLQPYVFIIYIAFFVFLIIAVLLVTQFFTEIAAIQQDMVESSSGGNMGVFSSLVGFDVEQIKYLLFNMALIEAIFGGLAAGKIGQGTFLAGIKHVVIMVMITAIIFAVI